MTTDKALSEIVRMGDEIAALRMEAEGLREAVRVLLEACSPLVLACANEFVGEVCGEMRDDEPVMAGTEGVSPITFGMIRRAKAALDASGNTNKEIL